MRAASRHIHVLLSLATLTLLLGGSGCSLAMLGNLDASTTDPTPDPGTEHEAILFSGAQLTLAWDPPPAPVASYKLYYRVHDTGTWALLDQVGVAPDPEYTIDHGILGNGDFDFGVIAVAEDEAESSMHTSLDNTAQPECGWYLRWMN